MREGGVKLTVSPGLAKIVEANRRNREHKSMHFDRLLETLRKSCERQRSATDAYLDAKKTYSKEYESLTKAFAETRDDLKERNDRTKELIDEVK